MLIYDIFLLVIKLVEEMKDLLKEFKKIANKKWIKSISNSFGSIGVTFEKELKKSLDALYFPDYEGIELKCTSRYSNYPLYLFTLAFDGPTYPEINRIVELYGAPDKDFGEKKVLFVKLNTKDLNKANSDFKFKIEVDKNEEKLYVLVYNMDNMLIERKSFVYFDSIRNHLILKLSNLAVIYASKKKFNDSVYFRYYKIAIYKLLNFNIFFSLLDEGIINLDLISRISKSGLDKGRYRNKNLVFNIYKRNISRLFRRIYEYNFDTKEYKGTLK